jgi:membrane associated rhomboid family serine protease
MGAKYTPAIKRGEVWRLVVPIMLHGGLIHLISNLFFQCRFGFVLEMRWGVKLFIAIYFIAGVRCACARPVR